MTTDETRPPEADGDPHELLLRRLRRAAARREPVPESLVFAARELLTWRSVDVELAELLADSAVDERRTELVRGEEDTRAMSFEAGELTIEIDVVPDGARRRLIGQLVPAEAATVEVQAAEERRTLTADAHGRFHAEDLPAGRLRLRITGHSGSDRPVETSWITI